MTAKLIGMVNDINTPTGPQPMSCGVQPPTIPELVAALTAEQHKHLENFAAKRLFRLRAIPNNERILALETPRDLVDEAIQQVLLGATHPKKGRHLKPAMCADTEAFVRGLMNVINSELSNLVNSAEAFGQHFSLPGDTPDWPAIDLPDPVDAHLLVRHRDLQDVLFDRLREQSQGNLQINQVIDSWEQGFLTDDRISEGGVNRKTVHQVRQLARKVLRDLAKEVTLDLDLGQGMLL